jgi:transposase
MGKVVVAPLHDYKIIVMAKIIVGVDISKKTFDVAISGENESKLKYSKFSNDGEGFVLFEKRLPEDAHIVMEASGSYYLQLATHLYEKGYAVSVINPLSMSHFIKMGLHRSKTDKKDAGYIADYGVNQQSKLNLWKPKPAYMLELQQLEALVDNLTRQGTKLKNMKEAFLSGGTQCDCIVMTSLKAEINHVERQIGELEKYMVELTEKHHAELFERVKSIPGLGKRNVMMLIVITDAFTKFENSKQLAAYVGLDPGTCHSGTSVYGSTRIKKMGMGRMRQLLYLAAMQAKKYNKACKELFDRLVNKKGKRAKEALIAVAHKLLRQAFAVGTGQKYYEEISAK